MAIAINSILNALRCFQAIVVCDGLLRSLDNPPHDGRRGIGHQILGIVLDIRTGGRHFYRVPQKKAKKSPAERLGSTGHLTKVSLLQYNWKRYRTMQKGGLDETPYSESGRMPGRDRRMDHPEYPLLVHRNQTARRKRHLRYHFILRFQLGVSFLQRYSRALHHTGMIAGDFLSHGDRDVNTTSYNSFLEALSKFLRGTAIRGIRCVYLYVG